MLFTKPPLAENYPGFIETEQYNFSDEYSQSLLKYGKELLNMHVELPGVNVKIRPGDGQADGAPPAAAMEVSQEPANRSGGQTPERDSPEPDRGPILENNIWGPE